MREITIKDLFRIRTGKKIVQEKKGASGVVYIVDNGENHHPRRVAYKTFQERFHLDAEKQQHFKDECEKWLRLRNAYIATPFHALVVAGQPFICMEYYHQDLKSLMEEHSFSYAEALVIIVQIVKALRVIEIKGFGQHQDLNPPNILLKDLRETFRDYPAQNLLNYEVAIADFGMLDLFTQLGPTKGANGGKFPFKAPEQYEGLNKKYPDFRPDTFALGVMMYMLIAGKHPAGMSVRKALNKNTKGGAFERWALNQPSIKLGGKALEDTINGCLKENPSERPPLQEILDTCLAELKAKAENAYENLRLRFKENDKWDNYMPEFSGLYTEQLISELPGKRAEVLSTLKDKLIEQRQKVNGPESIVYYCETLMYLLRQVKKEDNLESFVIERVWEMVELLKDEHSSIKASHRYPSHSSDGELVYPVPANISDFEVSSNYISNAILCLEKFEGIERTFTRFKGLGSKVILSMYYYHKASIYRNKNPLLSIEYLNRAKELHPDEWIFDHMASNWYSRELASLLPIGLNEAELDYIASVQLSAEQRDELRNRAN